MKKIASFFSKIKNQSNGNWKEWCVIMDGIGELSCERRESVLVLTSASLVWAKVSHQSSTESHTRGGNEPCEAGRREVSGYNASEGIEPRNNHRVGGRHCSFRGKTEFSAPLRQDVENPTGSKAVA